VILDWAGVAGMCSGGSGVWESDVAEGLVIVVLDVEPGEVTASVRAHEATHWGVRGGLLHGASPGTPSTPLERADLQPLLVPGVSSRSRIPLGKVVFPKHAST